MASEIFYSMIDTLCEIVQVGVNVALRAIMKNMLNGNFTPKVEQFNLYFNGNIEILKEFFLKLGFSLLIINVAAHFFLFILGHIREAKDTFTGLAVRMITCIIIIVAIHGFGDAIMDYGLNLVSIADEYFGDDGKLKKDSNEKSILEETSQIINLESEKENSEETHLFGTSGIILTVEDISFENSFPLSTTLILCLIKMFLRIIFFCIVCYNLIKLVIELVQRYATLMVLYIALPAGVACFGSYETEKSFFSYIRMFFVEMLVVILTNAWISMSFYLMENTVCDFIPMIFTIAFIRIGVGIEKLLKEMGLSTVSMGGALLDNVAATGLIMTRVLGGSKEKVANTLANGAALTGNMKLGQFASGLAGKGFSADSAVRTMENTVMGQMVKGLRYPGAGVFASSIAENGLDFNRSGMKILSQMNSADAINESNNVLKSLFGNAQNVIGADNQIAATGEYNMRKGLGVTVTDSYGNTIRSGFISSTATRGEGITSVPFRDANNKECYLNLNQTDIASDAECCNKPGTIIEAGKLCDADLMAGVKDANNGIGSLLDEATDDMNASAYKYGTLDENGNRDVLYCNNETESKIGTLTGKGEMIPEGRVGFGSDMWQNTHIEPANTHIEPVNSNESSNYILNDISSSESSNVQGYDSEIINATDEPEFISNDFKYAVTSLDDNNNVCETDARNFSDSDIQRMDFQMQFAKADEICNFKAEDGNTYQIQSNLRGEFSNAGIDAKTMSQINFDKNGTISFKANSNSGSSDISKQKNYRMAKVSSNYPENARKPNIKSKKYGAFNLSVETGKNANTKNSTK